MSNKLFDIIRFLCEILIPAIGTLYFGLSKIWGLPYGHEVVGTCSCIAVFLGAIIGISRANYNATIDAVDDSTAVAEIEDEDSEDNSNEAE